MTISSAFHPLGLVVMLLACLSLVIALGGVASTAAEIEDLVGRYRPVLDRFSATEAPTRFEVLTALALARFRDAGCRAAVLECGLGGETDATNAYDGAGPQALSLLTPIGLEHARHAVRGAGR